MESDIDTDYPESPIIRLSQDYKFLDFGNHGCEIKTDSDY